MIQNKELSQLKECSLKLVLQDQKQLYLSFKQPLNNQHLFGLITSNQQQINNFTINLKNNQIYFCLQNNQKYRLQLSPIQQSNSIQQKSITNQTINGSQMFLESQINVSSQQIFLLKRKQRNFKQTILQMAQKIESLQNKITTLQDTINSKNKEINYQLQVKIPDPIMYAPIQFYDGDRHVSYTDCWEISVLRFLHLVFGQNGQINHQKLPYFMEPENKNCNKLIQYFKQNPSYHLEEQFYTTKEGFQIRSLWAQFLNNSKLMKLKIDGKYQVAATIPNLIAFYRGFFPKLKINNFDDMSYENILTKQLFICYEDILKAIYSQFSEVAGFKIDMKFDISVQYTKKPDFIFFSLVQKIFINDLQTHQLEWEIYEYYKVDEHRKVRQRMMGHSDYRYNKQTTQREEQLQSINMIKEQLQSSQAENITENLQK